MAEPSLDDTGQQAFERNEANNQWLSKIGQTWPARAAMSALEAFKLPGQVYSGEVQLRDEGGKLSAPAVDKIAELASMISGGSFAMPAVKGGAGMGIRAYHGSPHDFDRFDLSKIGTGEGAQAYGHGLYFAEKEGTAKSYRDALTRDKDRVLETGNTLPPWVANTIASRNPIAIDDMRRTFQGRMDEDLRALADPNTMQPWNIEPRISNYKQILKAIDEYAAGAELKPLGRMYEVEINAHPDQFLDWDKPVAQQGSKIDQAVWDILQKSGVGKTDANYIVNNKTGQDVVRRMARPSYPIRDDVNSPWRAGGASLDESLAMVGGDKRRVNTLLTPDPVYTSDALRSVGIPGIKYLDQGSRAAGDGSRNYVVFDDKIVNILRKYGIAAGATTPPAFSALAEFMAQGQPQGDQ